ncbi:MAG: hypothetical protein MUF34_08860 [Polyangiaceae bacterium]|jgi:hypothetical protein|nr:hypothetical protein [Polyangiaceae bacterium]
MALTLRASASTWGRSRRRGVTLVETLIVLVFLGTVGSLVTLAVSAKARARVKTAVFGATPAHLEPSEDLTALQRTGSNLRAHMIRSAALRLLEHRAESACPSLEQLFADRQVDHATFADAWNNTFELSCAGDDVFVRSAGPDRLIGTDDDVVAPKQAGNGGRASTASSP